MNKEVAEILALRYLRRLKANGVKEIAEFWVIDEILDGFPASFKTDFSTYWPEVKKRISMVHGYQQKKVEEGEKRYGIRFILNGKRDIINA